MSYKYFCNSFQVTIDLLNSENLKVAITWLCKELQVCNFTMNNIFKQNSLNAIVFKLQVKIILYTCN